MEGFQHLVPTFDGSDNSFRVGSLNRPGFTAEGASFVDSSCFAGIFCVALGSVFIRHVPPVSGFFPDNMELQGNNLVKQGGATPKQ